MSDNHFCDFFFNRLDSVQQTKMQSGLLQQIHLSIPLRPVEAPPDSSVLSSDPSWLAAQTQSLCARIQIEEDEATEAVPFERSDSNISFDPPSSDGSPSAANSSFCHVRSTDSSDRRSADQGNSAAARALLLSRCLLRSTSGEGDPFLMHKVTTGLRDPSSLSSSSVARDVSLLLAESPSVASGAFTTDRAVAAQQACESPSLTRTCVDTASPGGGAAEKSESREGCVGTGRRLFTAGGNDVSFYC